MWNQMATVWTPRGVQYGSVEAQAVVQTAQGRAPLVTVVPVVTGLAVTLVREQTQARLLPHALETAAVVTAATVVAARVAEIVATAAHGTQDAQMQHTWRCRRRSRGAWRPLGRASWQRTSRTGKTLLRAGRKRGRV